MGRDIWTLTSAAGDNTRTGCQRFHNISRKITDDSTMKVFVLLVTLASLAEGSQGDDQTCEDKNKIALVHPIFPPGSTVCSVLYGRRCERLDAKQQCAATCDACDLVQGQHLWEVYVVSYGFTPGYETEDPVYVILHGDLGTSSPLQLEDPRERNPDNVRHDIFTLEEDIGSLVSIEVFKEGDDDWIMESMEVNYSNLQDDVVKHDFNKYKKPLMLNNSEGLRKELFPL